jgi:hypothetical protein
MDFVYDFIGALVGTFIVSSIFKLILFKFLDKNSLVYVSFIGSSILILSLTSFTMGFVTGFITYMPALFIWFVVGLIKTNKKKVKNDGTHTDSLHIDS